MRKPDKMDGKSSGSHHSVWEALENMNCDFRQCHYIFKLIWIYPEVGISSSTSNFIVLHLCARRGT